MNKVSFVYNNRYDYSKVIYIKRKINDTIKDRFCLNNNINLIRIPYFEFDNIEKIIEKIWQ